VPFLNKTLSENNIKAEDISIDLKEATLIKDLDKKDGAVQRLIDAGIQISIDDFGTGSSSLAHLHQFPVSLVKIDNSFVQQLEQTSTSLEHIHKLIKAITKNRY